MPVDFKNKLFGKALWGYAPEEVDEYIAYVAGEYTKLERRLAAIRREAALTEEKTKEQEPVRTPLRSADAVSAPEERSGTDGGEAAPAKGAPAEASADELAVISAEAEVIFEEAKREADKTLGEARLEADNLLESARTAAERIRTVAGKRGEGILTAAEAAASEMTENARREADAVLAEAEKIREEARAEQVQLELLRQSLEDGLSRLEDGRKELEAEKAALLAEKEEFAAAQKAFEAEKEAVSAERERAAEAGRRAEEAQRGAEAKRAGLSAASARFRDDLRAFANAAASMAQAQMNAAERFSGDADRFLAEIGDPELPPPDAEDGDPFGFAAAAAMIGGMLGEMPDEDGGAKEQAELPPDEDGGERTEAEEPAVPAGASGDVDAMLAESAVSDHVSAAADDLRRKLEQIAIAAVESGEADGFGEPAVEIPDGGDPDGGDGTEAAPRTEIPDGPAVPEETTDEKTGAPDDAGAGEHDAAPGDEELAAVMAALSGITEDESYDAMLASFDTDSGVDPAVAADLERKRRETFRRMMKEAEREREAEKRAAEKRRADAADGERMLEDRISAAVEAAVRARQDPEKVLDEAFPELAESGGENGDGNFSAEMLEMIDFEEPREDGAAWTDHSLEEFTARHGGSDDAQTDGSEGGTENGSAEDRGDPSADAGPKKED